MSIRPFLDQQPSIASDAFVDDSAVIIGAVTIAEQVSIWPLCVLRGDVQRISIGPRTNIQDSTVIHVTHDSHYCPGGLATQIGAEVTVGHRALLHACTVEDRCLVGMGAIVMDGAVLESEVILGAGSVVPPGKRLQSGYLYVGSPAKQIRPITDGEREFIAYSAANYVRLKDQY